MAKKRLIKEAAKKMPPLYHKLPEQEFDIQKARTLWWLVKQPDILNAIWNEIKQSGSVVFNPETGKWQGVDFVPEEEYDEFENY